jgi:hypothetical protein
MAVNFYNSADALISDLKGSIGYLWIKYGGSACLDSLAYSEKEYGCLQRGELAEIIRGLGALKEQVDRLSEDCRDLPVNPGINSHKMAGQPQQTASGG